MKKIFFNTIWLAAVLLVCSPAGAYVLHPAHILDLMTKNLGKPKRLLARQEMVHYGAIPSSSLSQTKPKVVKEEVSYKFPKKFRSDIKIDSSENIHIVSSKKVLKIINGKVTSNPETWIDLYKDILLYRDRVLLNDHLAMLGVDVTISSLGRFQDKVVFIIGAKYPDESVSQIWVDKTTLRPIRWLIIQEGEGNNRKFEIRYNKWQQTKRIWYPVHIEFYSGSRLIRLITVNDVIVNPSFSKKYFDISYLKSIYPSLVEETDIKPVESDLSDVERSIRDFGNITDIKEKKKDN